MFKSETYTISLPVIPFSNHPEKKRFACTKETFQILSDFFKTISDLHSQSSEVLAFQILSNLISMTSINLRIQTNDSFKNAFGPSDLRRLYSGHTSEVIIKIRTFAAGMLTLFANTFENKSSLFSFLVSGKIKFCSKLKDEHLQSSKALPQ
jgi:hypothetical protein